MDNFIKIINVIIVLGWSTWALFFYGEMKPQENPILFSLAFVSMLISIINLLDLFYIKKYK